MNTVNCRVMLESALLLSFLQSPPSLMPYPISLSLTTTTIESKIGSEIENVPFCVALNKDAGVYAKAEKIHHLTKVENRKKTQPK